jgi:hypothetical protein
MNRRILRRVAVAIIALLAFAQANVALAACPLDRAGMAQAVQDGGCCDGPQLEPAPQLTNGCVAHCTSDLQLAGLPTALVRAPADAPVLFVFDPDPHLAPGPWAAPPPVPIASRILLHSFLI